MSRRIITSQLQTAGAGIKTDAYFDRVIKYIPADIVGAWIAASGLINSTSNIPRTTLLWIIFVVGLIFTPTWTLIQTKESKKRLAITQTIISTGAFIVWVLAIGGPFATMDFYRPVYGSLLLIFYPLLVGLVIPPEG